MSDETPKLPDLPKKLSVPLTTFLPAYLKDPANYDRVNKLIIETLASKHSHGEVIEWAKCAACQKRFAERSVVLKKLGFKSVRQYMAWQKQHQYIKGLLKKDSLPKYDE